MYSSPAFFPNSLPSPYMLQNTRLNPNLPFPVQHPLMNNFFQMPTFNHALPAITPQIMPSFSDPLSMLKYQNQLLAHISTLQSVNNKLKTHHSTLYSNPAKFEIPSSSPSLKETVDSDSPIENLKVEPQPEIKTSLGLPNDPDICFEAQIKYMIQFFVNNFGTATTQEVRQAKQKYSNNPQLLQAFEALESKYTVTNKTREEMVKWAIRRCLKITKASIKKGQKKDQKQALRDLCARYFRDFDGEEDDEDGNEGVERVLPFRKNSKNRTMNTQFVTEIFQSEEFRSDYKEFVKNMDEITEKENSEKISKLTAFIVKCSKKQDFRAIGKYKRIPWLKVWLENTKKVAEELQGGDYDGKISKKTKTTC